MKSHNDVWKALTPLMHIVGPFICDSVVSVTADSSVTPGSQREQSICMVVSAPAGAVAN